MAFPHPAIKAYYRARGDLMPPADKPRLGRCPWQRYERKPYRANPAILAALEAAHRADTAECSICGNHFPVAEGVVLRGRFYCRAAVPSFDPVVRLVDSDAVEPAPPAAFRPLPTMPFSAPCSCAVCEERRRRNAVAAVHGARRLRAAHA